MVIRSWLRSCLRTIRPQQPRRHRGTNLRGCDDLRPQVRSEPLEDRAMLAAAWQNSIVPGDVTGDGLVTIRDLLVVVDELNSQTLIDDEGRLPGRDAQSGGAFLDTSGDGLLTLDDIGAIVSILNVGDDSERPAVTTSLPAEATATLVPLEVSESTIIPTLLDEGDFYWADGRQISLLRRTDQVVVGLNANADLQLLSTQWATTSDSVTIGEVNVTGAPSVAPAGESAAAWETDTSLDAGVVALTFSPEWAGDLDTTLTQFSDLPSVEWAAPVFLNSESGLHQVVTDEIIVALEPGTDAEAYFGVDLFSGYRPLLGTSDQFVASAASDNPLAVLDMAATLANDPRVAWADPNFYSEFEKNTTDLLYSDQWHLNNDGQSGGTSNADVNAPEAWSTATGDGIVIAVLDDGVQTDHPDLNMWQNPGETATNGTDDDSNGWTDDVYGWNFVSDNNDPGPSDAEDNHGTAVAGVACANGNNGLGGVGVAYDAQCMALKMSDGSNYASSENVAKAINYAAGQTADGLGTWAGADVLNWSWSLSPSISVSNALDSAATNGRNGLGLPIFVATGNSASKYVHSGTYTLGLPSTAEDWSWVFSYDKDGNGVAGEDTIWIDKVTNTDGAVETFESASAPAGWDLSPSWGDNEAGWSVDDDPEHSYGTGRYQLRADSIGNNEEAVVMAPKVSVANSMTVSFLYWHSSAVADTLEVGVYRHSTGTYYPSLFSSKDETYSFDYKQPTDLGPFDDTTVTSTLEVTLPFSPITSPITSIIDVNIILSMEHAHDSDLDVYLDRAQATF